MKVVLPPLKSQGIKTKLVPWIKSLVPDSVSGRWIEPFLGTGVVGINSRFSKAILSDINPHIIKFYRSIQQGAIAPAMVREYLEREGEKLRRAGRNGYDHFDLIRNRFNENHDPLDFLFLSRVGFNGMMRFNRKGEWNIPFCKKPERLSKSYVTKVVNQVQDVALLIQPQWEFRTAGFEDTILEASHDDIIYCDPPYSGRYVDYYNGWTEEDERSLFELLSTTQARFILSTWHHNEYRKNEMIEHYWQRFNIVTRDHFYHAGGRLKNRRSVVEALVFNFPANIEGHNHGTRPKARQPHLLEEQAPYLAR